MDSHYQTVDGKRLPSDKQSGRKWTWRIVIHAVCLLWLGPIITLLYLNFSRHIIGPGLWCAKGSCSIYDDDGEYSVAKANTNDRRNHDVAGTLLFVAKGLEVWFMFVAGLLVYEAQKVLRKSKDGLPDTYSLTHLEFSDLLFLFKISKWTLPIRDAFHSSNRPWHVSKLCAFVLLACLMTLLVNLMGPSTGVLILPSVQSLDQPHNASERFIRLESDKPPAFDSRPGLPGPGLVDCTAEQLQNHSYSCAEYVRGSELDSMTSFVAAPMRTIEETTNRTDNKIHLAESQEDQVQFLAFNFSYGKKNDEGSAFNSFTVPVRQTLRMVSADIDRVINDTHLMNTSMQVSSQRNGPGIAVSGLNANDGPISSTLLGDNKSVTCLGNWMTDQMQDQTETYTKCIRNGTGWNITNSQAGFSIRNLSESADAAEEDNKLEVLVYFSDKTTYYGGHLNRDAHDLACLQGNLSAPCDWDDIFSPDKVNGSSFNGNFNDTTVVEWSLPSTYSGFDPGDRIWFEFESHLQFGVYTVDLSFEKELYMASWDREGLEPGDQLVIDPLWMLAAWSVDVNGTVDAARFPTLLPGGTDYGEDIWYFDEVWFEFYSLNIFAIAQTMSLISYDSVVLNESTGYDRNKDRIFDRWATRRVWAYGLDTRTSRLGVVVAIAGMVTVIFRLIFAVYIYRPKAKGNFGQLETAAEYPPT